MNHVYLKLNINSAPMSVYAFLKKKKK